MGVELPQSGNVFIPEVPSSIKTDNEELANYLTRVRRTLTQAINNMFSNDLLLADAINSGTSGTFTISSGGSIVITSGIVITVSS